MFCAVFIEASHTPNLIDNNIILDTDEHGIYSHDSDRITVAHNLTFHRVNGFRALVY